MCHHNNSNPSKVDYKDKTKVSIVTVIALAVILMTDLKSSAHKVQSHVQSICCNKPYCRILAFM